MATCAQAQNYLRDDGTFHSVVDGTASGDLLGNSANLLSPVAIGTGIATALGVNVGTAGSFVVNGGALGTPSSGSGANITNVNAATLGGATFAAPGAIGGGTAAAGTFTALGLAVSQPMVSGALFASSAPSYWQIDNPNMKGPFLSFANNGEDASGYVGSYLTSTFDSSAPQKGFAFGVDVTVAPNATTSPTGAPGAIYGGTINGQGTYSDAFGILGVINNQKATTKGWIGTFGSITGGSSYTSGTYNGVALTGGTGSLATANIVVSGGGVTSTTLVQPGTGYTVGDVLSAPASSIGGTGSGFHVPVATIVSPTPNGTGLWGISRGNNTTGDNVAAIRATSEGDDTIGGAQNPAAGLLVYNSTQYNAFKRGVWVSSATYSGFQVGVGVNTATEEAPTYPFLLLRKSDAQIRFNVNTVGNVTGSQLIAQDLDVDTNAWSFVPNLSKSLLLEYATDTIPFSIGFQSAAIGGPAIVIGGSTSGSALIKSPATGGGTMVLPTASGNLIGTGDTGTVTNTMLAGSIANAKLANSTISGVALGGNLFTLTFDTHLSASGSSYNGSAAVSIVSDATAANTASTIMARDGSNQVAATTFTGALVGNASTASSTPGNALSGTVVGSGTSTSLASTILASSLTSLGTITSLTVTTISAHTLGGTISGGGNQINNVIIGTSTPLAGTFTALTANSISLPTATDVAGPSIGNGSNTLLLVAGTSGLQLNNQNNTVVLFSLSNAGAFSLPLMAQTSVAQSGSVCFNSGTGLLTYDATLGCLASTLEVKDDWNDISPDECLAKAVAMRAGSFTYKTGRGLPTGEQIGFNAQQIAAVDERLVARDGSGKLLGVRYQQASSLYACALSAVISHYRADNDNLQHEIDELKRAHL